MGTIEESIREGNLVVVVGDGTARVAGHRIVVDARMGDRTIGPLEEARLEVERLLGTTPRSEQGERIAMSARRRLLGVHWEVDAASAFVDAINRAYREDPEMVLVVHHADDLDQATLETLIESYGDGGGAKMPAVLCFEEASSGALRTLSSSLDEGAARVTTRAESEGDGTSVRFDPMTLPPEVLRVLRAAVVLGPAIDVEKVAMLLDLSALTVAENVQRAVDLGAPISDEGNGVFVLAPSMIERLAKGMLPTLVGLLHRRYAEMLSLGEPLGARGEGGFEVPPLATDRPRFPDVFDGPPASAPLSEAPRVDASGGASDGSPPAPGPSPDRARAASHFEAAGELARAVEQMRAAAESSAMRGDPRRALALIERARTLLERLPEARLRRSASAQLSLTLGEILWRGAVLGSPFTLDAALAALDGAAAVLPEDADPGLFADIARTRAGVLYDRGDIKSLETAIAALSEAIRLFSRAGRPLDAAQLLNDQAAVYLRAGDPVRATHLMTRAQEVFEKIRAEHPDDLVAAIELAHTDHLLAKLPLHATVRPGSEADAISSALDHALAAERVYRSLEDVHALGRIWETMGRLELARGRGEEALRHLDAALDIQRRAGDMVGLARTTAALSEACRETDRAEDALTLLADSIELNARKGSVIGLAYNREAVEEARATAGEGPRAELFGRVETLLEDAEDRIGRAPIPGT